jgi:hypothetical protein
MDVRIAAPLAVCAILSCSLDALAADPATEGCEAWYEHYLTLMSELPPYADALQRATDLQRAAVAQQFVADCERVTADPDPFEDDVHALNCVSDADSLESLLRCLDPTTAERERENDEAYRLVGEIRLVERVYQAAWDLYVACDPTPPQIPGSTAAPFEGGGLENFRQLAWLPDGDVLCRYSVAVSDDGMDFEITAECDEDGDGEIAIWKASRDEPAHRVTADEVR